MKPRWKPIIIAVLVAVLVLSMAGVALAVGLRGNGDGDGQGGMYRGGGYGAGQAYGNTAVAGAAVGEETCDGSCTATDAAAVALSATEQEELLYMREEEKLARDVYLVLYEKWGVDEFSNIAASESRHMESVKKLLDRYGLTDPVGADTPGVFTDPDLQKLYDGLVAQGGLSVAEAYKVGVAIEEVDIVDLQELIAASTHRDITRVAQNLLRGSQRHLAAFNNLVAG